MKKVLGLFVFALIINGCDDGNLTQDSIDFGSATAQSCSTNDLIYKLNSKEALILDIPSTSFTTEPSTVGSPTVITIDNSTNRVVYRLYNGTVATDNICETIAPATPYVTDQWNATGGTIEIFTEAQKTNNTTENSSRISGYKYTITFKNITFAKSSGTQVYETLSFGDYVTTASSLPFLFDETLEKCSNSNQIYNYTTSEALMLNIDPNLILNETTTLNSPRTGLIGTTKNVLNYRLFSGLLTSDYFCNSTTPTTPTLSQEWNGVSGVTGVSGIVEVTTTSNGPGSFKHTIVLKKVTLSKGNNSFLLGDNFVYGVLITSN